MELKTPKNTRKKTHTNNQGTVIQAWPAYMDTKCYTLVRTHIQICIYFIRNKNNKELLLLLNVLAGRTWGIVRNGVHTLQNSWLQTELSPVCG